MSLGWGWWDKPLAVGSILGWFPSPAPSPPFFPLGLLFLAGTGCCGGWVGRVGVNFWFSLSLSWVLALPGFFARSLCVRVRVDKYIYRDNKIYGCGGWDWGKWGGWAPILWPFFLSIFSFFFCWSVLYFLVVCETWVSLTGGDQYSVAAASCFCVFLTWVGDSQVVMKLGGGGGHICVCM